MDQKLCLEGDFAQKFLKNRIGDKVTISVTGVLTQAGKRPDYDMPRPVEPGKKGSKPKEKPFVEFVISSVDGRSGARVADLTDDEMETEAAKTMAGEYDD